MDDQVIITANRTVNPAKFRDDSLDVIISSQPNLIAHVDQILDVKGNSSNNLLSDMLRGQSQDDSTGGHRRAGA